MAHDGSGTFFELIHPKSGAVLAALTADLLADGLDAKQIAALGGFITVIGDSLAFISAQMALQENSRKEPEARHRIASDPAPIQDSK